MSDDWKSELEPWQVAEAERVLAEVSSATGYSVDAIRCAKRSLIRGLAAAQDEVAAALRAAGLPLAKIGAVFDADHTCIMYRLRRHKKRQKARHG
ncbi:MAG TPA: hypothetical protein VK001_00100 [Geminicoccaceae bacterium]|nr:hypothetical protein [Geminicoccaceae bacterium]